MNTLPDPKNTLPDPVKVHAEHVIDFKRGELSPWQHVVLQYGLSVYSWLSRNGHLYKTDTSVKWTPKFGPCLSLQISVDSL